jgi:DNA-binding CsgD family transcriptional regulator
MSNLKHTGTKKHSGRYPWGSGKDPEQRGTSLKGNIDKLHDEGLSDLEIAKGLGIKTTELRIRRSLEKSDRWKEQEIEAFKLREKGYSLAAISKKMNISDHTVKNLLDPSLKEKAEVTENIANILKKAAEEKRYIDVGLGVEQHLSITNTKLRTAIGLLEKEGYKVQYVEVEQLGTGKNTTVKVLTPPGVEYPELYKNRYNIKLVTDYSEDGGISFRALEPINNIDSKRVSIQYESEKDGLIELRRGVPDISLGNARYAQVRIGVDGTHYMKGMAMYSDDIPKGFDIIYNTNKEPGSDKVFKKNENDVDNPFGSTVRQKHYIDSDGKEKLSAINIIGYENKILEEGGWSSFSRKLSSQVLSKQSQFLAKKQLGLSLDLKKEEFDEIISLTNPAVKKRLLDSFADGCDSDAVHLKAAGLPRMSWHVLLPFKSIKENEVFAPNFENGESVVLIRHPHGGTFEIPELIVNNKNPEAIRIIGKDAKDAVGIHPKVASRLSGADFDGDDVLVIPNRNRDIQTKPALKGLTDFNHKLMYHNENLPPMKDRTKQRQMGDISNLITDMTIMGATSDELCKAVKHSMVVIDAQKHSLDYKKSAIDNGIPGLKKKYQGGERSGAATLISRAKSEQRVPYRKDRGVTTTVRNTDPLTGKKIYEYTGEKYYIKIPDKKGPSRINPKTGKIEYLVSKGDKLVPRMSNSTKMMEKDNAFELSSGTRIETVYASHANSLKELANNARKASLNIEYAPYSQSANKTYSREVDSLVSKLNISYRNKPLERQAQLLANKEISSQRDANPGMTPKELKKLKGRALLKARTRLNSKKESISITDREWEAIQAGAITKNRLAQILLNTDLDVLKEKALPRTIKLMSSGKINRAKSMLSTGYTRAEIANALGVSVSTLNKALE